MDIESRFRQIAAGRRVYFRLGYPWWLRPWLLRDVVAITLGRRIYLSSAAGKMRPESLVRLLRHELAHVEQIERLGLLRFLWRYLREFAALYVRFRSVAAAYVAISFEIEARAAEERGEEGTGL
jgi:hypothetical protein